jgi:uncharacterized RDD family membrane protein YckC
VTTRSAPVGYVGLVTRAIALLLDALVINGIAVLIGGAANLVASLFGHHGGIDVLGAALGAFAWIVWSLFYFVTFWTLTGQTVGSRILGIRVISAAGGRLTFRQSVRRFAGMILAFIPLGAGFLPVFTDERRRGFHDRLADTVVRWDVDEETESAVRAHRQDAAVEPERPTELLTPAPPPDA